MPKSYPTPTERVNIRYKSANNGEPGEKELPLKLLMLGNFTQQDTQTPLKNRTPKAINAKNFDAVLASHNIQQTFQVENALNPETENPTRDITLHFNQLKDFEPESIANQVPELQKLLALRKALVSLKGPLGNKPAFRKTLAKIIQNPETRQTLCNELGI